MHVKKGDNVIVTAGKDTNLVGEVLAIDLKKERVKVVRANMIKKHQKPNRVLGTEGEIVEKENWIHASNVALYSKTALKGVRTQKRFVGKDQELFNSKKDAVASFGENAPAHVQKVRFCESTGELFDAVKS